MSRRPAASMAATLAFAAALVAMLPAQAQESGSPPGPTLERLSFDPAPGDYTLVVRVGDFDLVARDASRGNLSTEGQIAYTLNGFPCANECARGQPALTNATSFRFYRLVAGDVIGAELRSHTGSTVYANRTEGNVTKVVPVRLEARVTPAAQHRVPVVAVTSGIPNEGDYTLRVAVFNFTLVPVGAGDLDTPFAAGHIVYTKNGAPCGAGCGSGAPETDATSFTFLGVQVGDRLGAELVRPSGASLAPRLSAVVVVAQPSIRALTPAPVQGDYTMLVTVSGFTLAPPGTPANPGTGHIVYLVQKKGSDQAVPARDCGQAATTKTEFDYCDLEKGDRVMASLVSGGLTVATTTPLEVLGRPKEGVVTPGVAVPLLTLVLALAAVVRRRA
jgi:hypothetical protein